MNLHGSTISFPFRVGRNGSLETTSDRHEIIAQAIQDIIETPKFQRKMMPDYGIDDFVFAVQDFSFAARLAFHLEEQIIKYIPLVKSVSIQSATDDKGRAIVNLQYTEVGAINAPRNLVFPVWQYIGGFND